LTHFGQKLCPSSGALDCIILLMMGIIVAQNMSRTLLPNHRPTAHWVIYTTSCIIQSNVPDDGHNCCPKHVELI